MEENIHIQIANTSFKLFETLPKTGKPKEYEWTVLSCIVQEGKSSFEVVALGTGSKCIGQTQMCPKGTILNDSHAEVMCRRSFLRYLYDQITSSDNSIFLLNKEILKFSLKPNIKFHFFTTHVPCGDATIFPKQNVEDIGEIIKCSDSNDIEHAPAKKRKVLSDDIFRTGAKSLKEDARQGLKQRGSEYHVLGLVRTKPGRGDPTASISCSDKLSKWCHLGIQGALLSMLLDKPIYLSSFTIAGKTPFCPKALERALYGRLGHVELLAPYERTLMKIGQVNMEFSFSKSEDKQACASSISWTKTKKERPFEVAVNGRRQGLTKKHFSTESGKLKICKIELSKQFFHTVKEFNINLGTDFGNNFSYSKVKYLAKEYQENWNILKKRFGSWSSKNSALLEFDVT